MIFPTIMFWVWMQAQSTGTVTLPVCSDSVTSGCVYMDTSNRPAKPAEHVIEIRTKREDRREIWADCNYCDDHGCTLAYCEMPKTAQCKTDEEPLFQIEDETFGQTPVKRNHFYCERVTREIWIDGVKWGVLRERGQ